MKITLTLQNTNDDLFDIENYLNIYISEMEIRLTKESHKTKVIKRTYDWWAIINEDEKTEIIKTDIGVLDLSEIKKLTQFF